MGLAKIAGMVDGHQMTAHTHSKATLQRDAALARIGRARRWLIAGAAGLTGAIAAFVSATAHGHTLHRKAVVPTSTRTTGSSSTSPSAHMPPLASPHSLGLQGPAQDPQSSSSGSSQPQSGPSSSSNQPQSNPSPQSQAPAAPAPAPSSGAVVSGGS